MRRGENETPLTWELYQLLPKSLTTLRLCTQCGASFKECDNIGIHLCNIHPGVRMLACLNGTAFYSCCGRWDGSQGCLEADHMDCVLDVGDVHNRIRQIRDSATILVAKLLLRFITQPLQSSILYNSSNNPANKASFSHTFKVLKRAEETTSEAALTHSAQIGNTADLSGLFYRDDVVSKYFDLHKEADLLWRSSKESPLFSRLSLLGKDKNEKVRADCENVWRSQIGKEQDAEEEVGCVFKERPAIPFIIVSRINDK